MLAKIYLCVESFLTLYLMDKLVSLFLGKHFLMTTYTHDVLIIGSGAAGLTVALNLPSSTDVAILSKGSLTHASTWYAQGGVAAVLDKKDSLDSHVADTHVAVDTCHAFSECFFMTLRDIWFLVCSIHRIVVVTVSALA